MEYKICWKDKRTGEGGHGDSGFTWKEAEKIVTAYNKKYPSLHHWVEWAGNDEKEN